MEYRYSVSRILLDECELWGPRQTTRLGQCYELNYDSSKCMIFQILTHQRMALSYYYYYYGFVKRMTSLLTQPLWWNQLSMTTIFSKTGKSFWHFDIASNLQGGVLGKFFFQPLLLWILPSCSLYGKTTRF